MQRLPTSSCADRLMKRTHGQLGFQAHQLIWQQFSLRIGASRSSASLHSPASPPCTPPGLAGAAL